MPASSFCAQEEKHGIDSASLGAARPPDVASRVKEILPLSRCDIYRVTHLLVHPLYSPNQTSESNMLYTVGKSI